MQEDDTDLTKQIKKKILAYLNDKYNNPATQRLLEMASALDPRFKQKYVSEDNRGSIEARLTTKMKRVMSVTVITVKIILIYSKFNLVN